MVKRTALIGDVHGEADALATVLAFLDANPDLDTLLCTGDITDTNRMLQTQRCCELLAAANVQTIRGNHDRWFTEEKNVHSFLNHLPVTRSFETTRGKMLLCHGLGNDDMAGIYPGGFDSDIALVLQQKNLDTYQFLVAGHTHWRMVRNIGNTTILNPGTLLTEHRPGFLVADFIEGIIKAYDLDPVSYLITEAKLFRLNGATSYA